MSREKFYRIGEFSKKTGIPVRTLHYYDEMNLLTPRKEESSGHRLYSHEDASVLQKIVTFQSLGYRLEEIKKLLTEKSFDLGLKETLQLQKESLKAEKERIETTLTTIDRTMKLLEQQKEVDGAVLMSLIHAFQTEKEQRQLAEKYIPKNALDSVFSKTKKEELTLDQAYIEFCKGVKELCGSPIEDAQVQQFLKEYVESVLEYIGEETFKRLPPMENMPNDELEKWTITPFSEEEEEWLNQALAFYLERSEKE